MPHELLCLLIGLDRDVDCCLCLTATFLEDKPVYNTDVLCTDLIQERIETQAYFNVVYVPADAFDLERLFRLTVIHFDLDRLGSSSRIHSPKCDLIE